MKTGIRNLCLLMTVAVALSSCGKDTFLIDGLKCRKAVVDGFEVDMVENSSKLTNNLSLEKGVDGNWVFKVKNPVSADVFNKCIKGKCWFSNFLLMTTDKRVYRSYQIGGGLPFTFSEENGTVCCYLDDPASEKRLCFEMNTYCYNAAEGIFRMTDKNGKSPACLRILYADDELIMATFYEMVNSEREKVSRFGMFRPVTEDVWKEFKDTAVDGFEFCERRGFRLY